MRIIFVRHAEPDYLIDSLTFQGWREAEALAPRVRSWEGAEFYSSPLGRAQDTARPGMRLLGREPVILPWLREFPPAIDDPETGEKRNCWDLFPKTWTRDDALYTAEWYRSPIMATGPVEEDYKRVTGELDAFLERHGYRREGRYYVPEAPNDGTVVFFCHLAISCVLISHLLSIPAPLLLQGLFLPPTGVTVIQTEERRPGESAWRLQGAGDVSHLRAAGVPISTAGYWTESWQL